MIKIVLILFSILITGCSLKAPANEWQYKSSNAFSSYTKNFLMGNEVLAKNDLSRAIKHSKKSADLTQLAKIYLGECALNISVGIKDDCKKYIDISSLLNDESLNAYYDFISLSIKKEQVKDLPKNYQPYAYNLLKKDYKSANQDILNISKATSSFICASLIKENIDVTTREKMISLASFNGYKKVVLFWLNESLKNNQNQEDIKNIKKKISILTKP